MNSRQILAIVAGAALIFMALRVPLPRGEPLQVWSTSRPDGFDAVLVEPVPLARILACLLLVVFTGVAVFVLRLGRIRD